MPLTKSIFKAVTLTGVTEILFDRYAGDNKTKLNPDQKLYLDSKQSVCLPALNILSFVSAQNTMSAPKMLLDKREYKSVADAMAACASITPVRIPFLRKDKPIQFGGFEEQADGTVLDKTSDIQVVYHVARLDKGIPNPKERPMLGLEWTLKFRLAVMPHPDLSEDLIEDLFVRGGQFLGLGTFRKVYGKFDFEWKNI